MPLYVQLSASLRREILGGGLPPGASLPRVQDLARSCGMSHATVMRAIETLSGEGLIRTRRGARSVVAARRTPCTEVMLSQDTLTLSDRQAVFLQQILEGLRAGYGTASRRFWMNFCAGEAPTMEEVLATTQVRNTDGLVAYRVSEALAAVLVEVSERVPVVSLFHPLAGGRCGVVEADVIAPFRRVLAGFAECGPRVMAAVGPEYMRQGVQGNPYAELYEEFRRASGAQGARFLEMLVPVTARREDIRRRYQCFEDALPDGSVLFLSSPLSVGGVDPRGRLRKVSYTECRTTLEGAGRRMTTLYAGLELLSRRAAEMLATPGAWRSRSVVEAQTVRPTVEI